MPKTYTTVPSVSTGDVYTATNYNTYTATNVSNLIVPPTVQVRRTTDLTSYSGDITFDTTAAFDTDGMFTSGTPTRITIQTSGLYLVSFIGQLTATATLTRALPTVAKNGQALGQGVLMQDSFGTSTETIFSFSGILNLTVSDYLTARVAVNGGSAYVVRGSASENHAQTRLTATWIGRTS